MDEGTKPCPEAEKAEHALICRNVVVSGRRTSLRMEQAMWDALADMAEREGMSIPCLLSTLDRRRGTISLTASVRVLIVAYFRAAVPPLPGTAAAPRQPYGAPLSPSIANAVQAAARSTEASSPRQ